MLTDKMDIGGAETHVLTLITELLNMNCSITLVTSGGVYLANIGRLPIKTVIAPLNKRDPFSISKSVSIISKQMRLCNVAHAHTRFTAFLATKARGNASFPAIVTTAHLNFPLFPFGPFAKWGDRTLAVSEDIREYLERNYKLPAENISLTKNAIDKKLYSVERNRHDLIIHTSRIDKGRAKTAFLLAECAEKLLRSFPKWRIVIVGDGNLFKFLKRKVDQVNEAIGTEGVILLGKRNDIPTVLAYGKIFIGASRAALEGMAAGLSTIVSGDEGYSGILSEANLKELLRTNFCARGMSAATKESITADLSELILNKKRRDHVSALGKCVIDKHFKTASMANDAYVAYREAVKTPSVALVGYFGYGNLGDEESLTAAAKLLLRIGISEVSVLAKRGCKLPPGTLLFDRESIGSIDACISRCDICIFAGGNLLQNETSNRSLAYYSQVIRIASQKRKPVYLLSSGIGRVKGVIGNILLKRSVRSIDFLGMRTTYDLSASSSLSGSEACLMPDFCFTLDEGKRGNNFTHFAWFASDRRKICRQELERIGAARGLKPMIILLFPSKDIASCRNLGDIRIYTPDSYAKLLKITECCEFTVSERLHGGIFSLLMHKPCYLFGDSEKNKALINEIERRHESNSMLLPFDIASIIAKKEIGANDSDFNCLINGLKTEIFKCVIKLFQQS